MHCRTPEETLTSRYLAKLAEKMMNDPTIAAKRLAVQKVLTISNISELASHAIARKNLATWKVIYAG